jgi:hypothetical protein
MSAHERSRKNVDFADGPPTCRSDSDVSSYILLLIYLDIGQYYAQRQALRAAWASGRSFRSIVISLQNCVKRSHDEIPVAPPKTSRGRMAPRFSCAWDDLLPANADLSRGS